MEGLCSKSLIGTFSMQGCPTALVVRASDLLLRSPSRGIRPARQRDFGDPFSALPLAACRRDLGGHLSSRYPACTPVGP